MNEVFLGLKPERVWYYFSEILKIPRPSKKEEKIAAWLVKLAQELNLEVVQDEIGNVLICKEAMPGYENRKTIILQSHIDMVCEKNSDVQFDFDNDAIVPRIEDGWVKATGTTLGADDGIGMAAQLAVLEARDIPHGPIECLFTVDEETGLSGAFGLDENFLKGRILLNLDSEDEGEIFMGCAGGKDTVVHMPYEREAAKDGFEGMEIFVQGLLGGHSGDDIHKGLGNANKILNRLLWNLSAEFGVRISSFGAGNLRNAIAREGKALLAVPSVNKDKVIQYIKWYDEAVRLEYKVTEPNLQVGYTNLVCPDTFIIKEYQDTLLNALYACPHGVISMSAEVPGFVETSTNLASVRTLENEFLITTSQRSSVETAKKDVGDMVASVFVLAGAQYEHTDGYPGWTPNPDSEILKVTAQAYRDLFNAEPKVLAIHAGLECGLIGEKYQGMDMVSFGPTIKGAHSPDERLNIETMTKFWDLLLEILEKAPDK